MAQQQVLEDEIIPRARPGQDGREQQPQQFEHASASQIDPSEVLPPHSPRNGVEEAAVMSLALRQGHNVECVWQARGEPIPLRRDRQWLVLYGS